MRQLGINKKLNRKEKEMTRSTQIIQSIKSNPEQWKSDGFNFKNDNIGTAVWVANGFFFIRCEPTYSKNPCTFSLIEKFNIWRAYKNCQKMAV